MDQEVKIADVTHPEYVVQITSGTTDDKRMCLFALTSHGRIFAMLSGYWYEQMSLKSMLKGN